MVLPLDTFERKYVLWSMFLGPVVSLVAYYLMEMVVRTVCIGFDDLGMWLYEWFHSCMTCSLSFTIARLARREMHGNPLRDDDMDWLMSCSVIPMVYSIIPIAVYALSSNPEARERTIALLFEGGLPALRFGRDVLQDDIRYSTMFFAIVSMYGSYIATVFGAVTASEAYEKSR